MFLLPSLTCSLSLFLSLSFLASALALSTSLSLLCSLPFHYLSPSVIFSLSFCYFCFLLLPVPLSLLLFPSLSLVLSLSHTFCLSFSRMCPFFPFLSFSFVSPPPLSFNCQVLITIYWLGRKAHTDPSYCGPQLNFKAFEGLLGVALSKVSEDWRPTATVASGIKAI